MGLNLPVANSEKGEKKDKLDLKPATKIGHVSKTRKPNYFSGRSNLNADRRKRPGAVVAS
jgi:hypothetical protein